MTETSNESDDLSEWVAFATDNFTEPADPRRDPIMWTVVVLALITVIGVILVRPTGAAEEALERSDVIRQFGFVSDFHEARVDSVDIAPCEFQPEENCATVIFELTAGPDLGEFRQQLFPDNASQPRFEVGDAVVLAKIPGGENGFDYQYSDRQRRPVLLWLTIAFAAAVVVLGGIRGVAALAGLGGSVAVLLLFVLPAILDGRSPVVVALVGASVIAYLALYLAHGFSKMTHVALLGTLSALGLTALLSSLVVSAAELSGLSSEEVFFLIGVETVDVRGLVLAGIVLGAAGALDDVTVTQASAVWELARTNPALRMVDLVRSGLRIGRDHIASTVNTLLLAYAGASLPLLVLLVLTDQSLGATANSEVIAIEIIRTMVGSIGLVAAVPFTTWLAAWYVSRHGPDKLGDGIHQHGHGVSTG